jgi:hypothetical protein
MAKTRVDHGGPAPQQEGVERVTYFMLRVHHPRDDLLGDVTGMVERLGAGEKRTFGSAQDLLALVRRWPTEAPTMHPVIGQSNAGDAGAATARQESGSNAGEQQAPSQS